MPCSREVKGVHEAEWGGSSSTTGGQVTGEVPPELGVLVDASQEDLLVFVFESEVEGLGGEVPNYVGKVAAPEWQEALFFGDTDKGIDDTWKKNINGEKSTTDASCSCILYILYKKIIQTLFDIILIFSDKVYPLSFHMTQTRWKWYFIDIKDNSWAKLDHLNVATVLILQQTNDF